MRRDSRLSGVLHVLLHMAERGAPVTSEALAKAMDTNPVVVRRVMAGLRDRGYVRSEKGHGGGWTLARDLSAVTLHDVYVALGRPSLLALGNRSEAPGCLVEQAVNAALGEAFRDAEALLLARLGDLTLAALSADVHDRLVARGGSPHDQEHVAVHGNLPVAGDSCSREFASGVIIGICHPAPAVNRRRPSLRRGGGRWHAGGSAWPTSRRSWSSGTRGWV